MTDGILKRKVAIAGGSGTLGRNIVDAILADRKWIVIVLSRQNLPNLVCNGAIVKTVDYKKHETLVNALYEVHTVISCINDINQSAYESSLALILACIDAKVKRFVPSEFLDGNQDNNPIYQSFKQPLIDAVKKSGMEYCLYHTGQFMDYYVYPKQSNPYLVPNFGIIDMENCTGYFAETGDEKFNMTLLDDIAKFVSASLDLDKWPASLGMVGSRVSFNEIIQLGEKVRGKKFDVKRIPVSQLLEVQKADDLSIHVTASLLQIALGNTDYVVNLNQLFPHITTTSISDLIEKYWGTETAAE